MKRALYDRFTCCIHIICIHKYTSHPARPQKKPYTYPSKRPAYVHSKNPFTHSN